MVGWLEKPVRGILLDITGVLKDGKLAIPGSVEAFKKSVIRNSFDLLILIYIEHTVRYHD